MAYHNLVSSKVQSSSEVFTSTIGLMSSVINTSDAPFGLSKTTSMKMRPIALLL